MKKYVVRLKVKQFMQAQLEQRIQSDKELTQYMNISITQIWRTKLPISDPRHNSPGNHFIAATLAVFGGDFHDFFYIEELKGEVHH